MTADLDLAFYLLRHPGKVAAGFRDRPPWAGAFTLLLLLILGSGAFLTGFLHGRTDPGVIGSMLTLTGALVSLAILAVGCFGLHINGRILDGRGAFVPLFVSFLYLFSLLLVLVWLPSFLLISFLVPASQALSWNLGLHLLFLVVFSAYAMRIYQVIYELDPGSSLVSVLLLATYLFVFAAIYRISGPWIQQLTR